MSLDKYLNILQELDSGDKIKVKQKVVGGRGQVIYPGDYDVIKRWEGGLLITDGIGRFFLSNKDFRFIEEL